MQAENSHTPGPPSGPNPQKPGSVYIAIALYVALTLPYACTKLNGDEAHFVTIPYLMAGGDYFLSAVKDREFGRAAAVAAESYALAWRYFVRPGDAGKDTAEGLKKYPISHKASGREQAFVFTPNYFVQHRKGGRPLLSFLLNIPALAVTYVLPRSLYEYQRDHIYHPAFLAPRLSVWLMGMLGLWLVHRIVRQRAGPQAAFHAALIYALLPATVVWSADLHQDVPMALFLIPFFYFLAQRRYLWAGVFWGLAFATKNQAVFALLPAVAVALWNGLDGKTIRERWSPILEAARGLAIVLVVGIAVSTPFGYPWGNLVEVWDSSSPDIPALYGLASLYYQMPLLLGIGMIALLGLKLLEDARDDFDRMHLCWLILPILLHFIHDYRNYMLVASTAILIGTYFRRKLVYVLAGTLLIINLAGMHSPYLSSRHMMYDWLNERDAPRTIEEIERIPGMGTIREKPAAGESPAQVPPAQPPSAETQPPAKKN